MDTPLVTTFCKMVRIDSESGKEGPFIEYLRDLFTRELGTDCTLDSYGNLIARVPSIGTDKSEAILLAAHADTVKPGRGIEPIVEDGMIHSAGETILGADDKAGIAEIFEAVRTTQRRPPVEIVITRGEEIGLLGAKHLDLSLITAKTGFIVDGEEPNTIIIGGPSHVSLDIEITGRAAHAGMEPEKGISAIRVAAKAISGMPEGRIDEETTANVGTIHGGLIRNGIPDKVTIQAECRSLNHDKCMRQADTMRRAFEDAAQEMGATIDIKVDLEYKASRVSEDAPAVKLAKNAIRTAGLTPKTEVITGGTDALILAGRGIDAVVLGYGGEAAHAIKERINISTMEQVVEIIRQILYTSA